MSKEGASQSVVTASLTHIRRAIFTAELLLLTETASDPLTLASESAYLDDRSAEILWHFCLSFVQTAFSAASCIAC